MARNIKKINALIKGISTRSAKQRDDIQAALVEAALFVFEDRNTDPAKRLMAAVGGETHRAGMSKWLSLNAAVHFANGEVKLSDERQKELSNTLLESEYADELAKSVPWYALDEANNTTPNIWDTSAALKKFDDYFLAQVKKFSKHDATIAEMLDRAHSLFRSEMAKVVEVNEVAE